MDELKVYYLDEKKIPCRAFDLEDAAIKARKGFTMYTKAEIAKIVQDSLKGDDKKEKTFKKSKESKE